MKKRTIYLMAELETEESAKSIKETLGVAFGKDIKRLVVDVADATKPKRK